MDTTKKAIVLDLSFPSRIPQEYVFLFNEVARKIQSHFQEFIVAVSRQYEGSLDWWVEGPPGRNTFVSPLFHYCCAFGLVRELINNHVEIDEIRCDSKALRHILNKFLKQRGATARVRRPPMDGYSHCIEWLRKVGRPFYSFVTVPWYYVRFLVIAKQTRTFEQSIPNVPLTLVDTFIYGGNVVDRYYPGLWDALESEEKEVIYFVPQFCEVRDVKNLFKQLRKATVRYLLKEDYLKWQDYFWAWGHTWRIYAFNFRPVHFLGLDLVPLVVEELRSRRGYHSAFLALLNYRFFKRLKEQGVTLRLAVDWFENQSFDKGWNMGLRDFYPSTSTLGYQGFINTPYYLCMFPTAQEKSLKLIPHEVALIGRGFLRTAKQFCPDLRVTVAPAFRFQGVWRESTHRPDPQYFTILIALPMMRTEGRILLRMIESILPSIDSHRIRFWIKPHPVSTVEQIQKGWAGIWTPQFEVVSQEFDDLVEQIDLLLSTASSSSMHALARGVPVVVVGSNSGLTHNPIPPGVPQKIWAVCYSSEELDLAITSFFNRKAEDRTVFERLGEQIREEYFEPVTRQSVREFLKLNTED